MKSFGIRLLAVAMALATLLLVDALILRSLPIIVVAVLLPLAGWCTARLFTLGLRPARRRRPNHTPPQHGASAPMPRQGALPATPSGGGRAA